MRINRCLFFVVVTCFALSASIVFAAGNAPQPNICDRSCWGARSPRNYTYMSSLNRAVVHHTAQPGDFNTSSLSQSAANVRAIQNMHMDVNGWSDIGYNFLVDKLGNIFEGRYRSMTRYTRGAHDSCNYNSFGFNCMGYFHSPYNQQPTYAMRQALYDVIAWRMPDPFTGYGSGYYNGRTCGYICGHRDVMATACPGDYLYQYIGTNYWGGEARNEVNARIVGGGSSGIIVDNDDASGYEEVGSWGTSTGSGYYGSSSRWNNTGSGNDYATWTPDLDQTGSYKVYAWWVASSNRANNSTYQVHHMEGASCVTVNQSQNGGQWNLLGTYNFQEGTTGKVVLTDDAQSGKVVSADAVRFEYQGPIELVVDNDDSTGYSEEGAWGTSTGSGYYGTSSRWNNTGSGQDYATWTPDVPIAGSYKVYAWWVASSNRASDAVYNINHMSGASHIPANQSQNGGKWNYLGTFSFSEGTGGSIVLTDDAESGKVVSADAVKLEYVGPPEIIVDNSDGGFSASDNWFTSTYVSGYYGSNYHARETASVSDSASWTASLPEDGSYKVYARWTDGTSRASSAPYIVYHTSGSTTVYANQQQNGGEWVLLGTFNMYEGTAVRVRLSCWTSSGDYVIADAVKFVRQ